MRWARTTGRAATVTLAAAAVGVAALAITVRAARPLPTAAPSSVERLIVAVPLPGTAAVDAASLEAELHLADPRAAAFVLEPGGAVATEHGITVATSSSTITIRPADPGIPLVIPLEPAPAASPAPSVDPFDALAPAPVPGVLVVEVLADRSGIVAHRVGDLVPAPDEVRLPEWRLPGPGEDAAMVDHAWWTLGPGDRPAPQPSLDPGRVRGVTERLLRDGIQEAEDILDLSLGDVTGDGTVDLAVAFRRPFRDTFLTADDPDHPWQDGRGRSAHVGILRPEDGSAIWVAGTLRQPVSRLAACDGALAVLFDALDDPRIVGGSAWDWEGFGLLPLAELPGQGVPVCIDVDRDGHPDPAIVERS